MNEQAADASTKEELYKVQAQLNNEAQGDQMQSMEHQRKVAEENLRKSEDLLRDADRELEAAQAYRAEMEQKAALTAQSLSPSSSSLLKQLQPESSGASVEVNWGRKRRLPSGKILTLPNSKAVSLVQDSGAEKNLLSPRVALEFPLGLRFPVPAGATQATRSPQVLTPNVLRRSFSTEKETLLWCLNRS